MAANTAPTLTSEDKAALFSHTKLGSWMLLHARLSTIGTRENSTPACVLTSPSLRDEQGWTLLHHAVDGGFAGLVASFLAMAKTATTTNPTPADQDDASDFQQWIDTQTFSPPLQHTPEHGTGTGLGTGSQHGSGLQSARSPVSQETPLHIAIRRTDAASAGKLTEYSARSDIPNSDGKTAVVLALEGVKEGEERLDDLRAVLGALL